MKKYLVTQDGLFIELTKEVRENICIVKAESPSLDGVTEGVLLSDLIESWNKDTNESW